MSFQIWQKDEQISNLQTNIQSEIEKASDIKEELIKYKELYNKILDDKTKFQQNLSNVKQELSLITSHLEQKEVLLQTNQKEIQNLNSQLACLKGEEDTQPPKQVPTPFTLL